MPSTTFSLDSSVEAFTSGPLINHGDLARIQVTGAIQFDINGNWCQPEGPYPPTYPQVHAWDQAFYPPGPTYQNNPPLWVVNGYQQSPPVTTPTHGLYLIENNRPLGNSVAFILLPSGVSPPALGLGLYGHRTGRDYTWKWEDLAMIGADVAGTVYRLWFVYMDSLSFYGDNVGSFTVQVDSSPDPKYWETFKYAEPFSWDDGTEGRICSASKSWFPGHRLVEVDGKQYGDVFAPEPQETAKGGRRGYNG